LSTLYPSAFKYFLLNTACVLNSVCYISCSRFSDSCAGLVQNKARGRVGDQIILVDHYRGQGVNPIVDCTLET